MYVQIIIDNFSTMIFEKYTNKIRDLQKYIFFYLENYTICTAFKLLAAYTQNK